MSAETTITVPKIRRRKTPAERLRAALGELAGGQAEIVSHAERSWASVTFAGTRHSVGLMFDGAEAVAMGEAFIDALPDHEFTLPRELVADAAIVAVEHSLLPAPRLTVTCELLLLDEG